jgi:hypothetical protein
MIVFIGMGGLFIGYFYEDAVKHIIINELNKRLSTEIVVNDIEKDIQFSVFRNFPYASVSFSNVVIRDAVKSPRKKANLLEAKRVTLQFSILDLISGKYKIKKIEAKEGAVKIKIYKDRTDNYHFWKPSSDTTAKDFSLDLQKVMLEKMAVVYSDQGLQHTFSVFARDVAFKGKFSDDDYNLNIDGDLYVYLIKIDKTVFLANKASRVGIDMHINTKNKHITFQEGGLHFGQMALSVTGNIVYANSPTLLDLTLKGEKIKLQTFIRELPSKYSAHVSDYDFGGSFNFVTTIKGEAGNGKNPLIKATVNITDGNITQKKNKVALSNVCFDVYYTNGKNNGLETSQLTINNFGAKLHDGNISGNFIMTNFNKPEISLNVSAHLEMKDIFDFLKTDTLASASGKISIQASYKGVLQGNSSFTVKDFIASSSTGTLEVRDAEIIFKGNVHTFSKLNGSFDFSNNDIVSKSFSGNYGSTDFLLKGEFRNILPYFFLENHPMMVNAMVESQFVEMNEILGSSENKKDTAFHLKIPDNINFNLSLNVKKLNLGKFSAADISGAILLKNKQLIAKEIKMKAMNGQVVFSGLMDGAMPEKILISCDASIKNVDITRLFSEMNNFGQKDGGLRDINLKGKLTADVQFASVWSSALKVDPKTIYANTNIVIENGELNNYEPLIGLSKYLKNRDLSRVSFQTLKNTIQIKNEVIAIPDMEIKSSAIDFKISGTHTFDQVIDYQLSVLISQLRGNGSKQDNLAEDIGIITDDGLHKEKYFFRITGTVDNPVYHTLDKEGYKKNIKTNLSKEKVTLKEILNREFGWFKKDSTINKDSQTKPEEKYDFNVIWDEEETPEKKE